MGLSTHRRRPRQCDHDVGAPDIYHDRMTRHVTRSSMSIAVAGLALSLAACSSTTTVNPTASKATGASSSTSSSAATSSTPTTTSSSAVATPTVQGAVQQMNAGFAKVTSARVVAQQAKGSDTTKIELAGTVDGKNQRGSITSSSTTDGGSVQFVVVDGKQYINGDAAFYKSAGSSKGATYAGKWVITPTSAKESFADLTLKSLFDELESDFTAA